MSNKEQTKAPRCTTCSLHGRQIVCDNQIWPKTINRGQQSHCWWFLCVFCPRLDSSTVHKYTHPNAFVVAVECRRNDIRITAQKTINVQERITEFGAIGCYAGNLSFANCKALLGSPLQIQMEVKSGMQNQDKWEILSDNTAQNFSLFLFLFHRHKFDLQNPERWWTVFIENICDERKRPSERHSESRGGGAARARLPPADPLRFQRGYVPRCVHKPAGESEQDKHSNTQHPSLCHHDTRGVWDITSDLSKDLEKFRDIVVRQLGWWNYKQWL